MKKLLRMMLCLTLVVSLVSDFSLVRALAAPQESQDYMINDNFEDPGLPSNITDSITDTLGNYKVQITSNKGEPWVFSPGDNNVQLTDDPVNPGNKVLKLYDNQDGSPDKGGSTRISNSSFSKQTNKTTVVAFDFMGAPIGSSTRFRLTNAGVNTALVSLETSGNQLVYRKADNTTAPLLDSLQPNSWYHVKIEIDMQQALYSVNVSGAGDAEIKNVPFYQSVSDFGNFDVNTGNSSIATLYLDNIQIYTPSIVPSAPTDLTTQAGNTQTKLSWKSASNATSYNIKRSTTPEGPFTTVKSNVTDLTFTDSGLTNDTSYYYVVSGVNSVGEGPDSLPVIVTPSSAVPLPQTPKNVTVTSKDSSINLLWDKVDSADFYTVKRSTSPEGPFVTIASELIDPTYTDKDVVNGTTYYYRVQASGVGGDGLESTPVRVQPRTPIMSPEELVANPDNKRVILNWKRVDGVTSYVVKRSLNNGGPYTTVATGVKDSTYTDSEVENGILYYYVVTAVGDQAESMISNQTQAMPKVSIVGAPASPTDILASAGNRQVELQWKARPDASFYTIKRSTTSSGPYTDIATGLSLPAFTDSKVENGTQYYYVVSASNAKGESQLSNELAVMPAKIIVVAQDGTGDYTTIQDAVNAIPSDNTMRTIIYIKNGIYKEKVSIPQDYVSIIGESRDQTVIDWDDYGGTNGQSGNVGSTFASQTVGVTGDYFRASNLTIKNSREPRVTYGTAVALSVKSDQAVFENMKIISHQDTLYTGSGRQYYHNSYIEGDVDFIFGEAPAVVFDHSEIHSNGTSGYVTAAAQSNESDKGFVFLNSRLTKDDSVTRVYLGRPWKNNPKTTFINTWMDDHIDPSGWSKWSNTLNHELASYAEYNSMGPGANAAKRVSWSKQLSAQEASAFTLPRIFNGWDPSLTLIMPPPVTLPTVIAPVEPSNNGISTGEEMPQTGQMGNNEVNGAKNQDGDGKAIEHDTMGEVEDGGKSSNNGGKDNPTTYTAYLLEKHAVRTGPSTKNRVLATLSAGSAVHVLNGRGKWVKIDFKGRTAFVYGEITKAKPYTAYLTEKHVVRTGPSTKHRRITTLTAGTAVNVLHSGKWARVAYKGRAAYVYGEITKTKPYIAYLTEKHAVRTGPSTKYKRMATFKIGTAVNVLRSGKWARIAYKGRAAYVYGEITKTKPYIAYLTEKHAVRTGPSTKYKRMATFKIGTAVNVLRSGKWARIAYKGRAAYVYGDLSKHRLYTVYLTKDFVIRTGSSTKDKIVARLEAGTAIQIQQLVKWIKIMYHGETAYLYGDVIKFIR
ncbi:pectinesterase family protein [Sporolactobacillus kofuensis]|uniref:Pectinesterase family protein n=1 Tax=Sporolactobacillus kofuensis TaxID=269672 RepID=A0ABW1WEQ0_9BACL|nr:pectinesterase family protein [Sporolactobacillus kofuensis]MCO7174977.1 pectinesterase family protein [Sporolactobacillus kofuensis]